MPTTKSGEKRKTSTYDASSKSKKPRLDKSGDKGIQSKRGLPWQQKKEDKKEEVYERGTTTSREAHAKQKQLAQERRAAKPLAEELARAKKLWERLRRKSHVPKDERKELVEELFGIVNGRVRDFVLKHDAVRAVQTAIKYATMQQRKEIAKELQGTYAQLAEGKYAKFLIGKLLVHTDAEICAMILSDFYGKVRRMINHPEASWILDDVYRGMASKNQKALLLREWYGPEFSLANAGAELESNGSAEATADLKEILENDPSKRGVILKHLLAMINGLVQKGMTGFTMLHDAMLQYYLNVPYGSEDQKEFLEMVKNDESGDLLKNMAFTKSGARLVCLLLAHGNAKDRKLLLRVFKDTFQLMCGDQHGHVIILAAYDLLDDTVLVAKSIVPEILGRNDEKQVENIIFCANDLYARTTVLYPLEGTLSKALFPGSHSADLEVLNEVHEIRKTTSKKDNETRRKELVTAMSPQLLAAVAASPRDLVTTSFGCQLIADVLFYTVGDKTEALEAIAKTASGATDKSDVDQQESGSGFAPTATKHISQEPFGTRMLKMLVAGGRFDRASGKVKTVDPPLGFANILYPQISEHLLEWATGDYSSFVVVALLEAADLDKEHAAEIKKTLSKKDSKKALEKASITETSEQKTKREEAEEKATAEANEKKDKKDKKDKKKNKGKKDGQESKRPVGNAGAKLLLEKLA